MKRLSVASSSGGNGFRGPMIASTVMSLGTSCMSPSAGFTDADVVGLIGQPSRNVLMPARLSVSVSPRSQVRSP